MRILTLIFSLLLYGCGSGQSFEDQLFERADYVFRCKPTTIETTKNKIIRYKPVEVLKGQIEESMLSDDGFLNYTNTISLDETIDRTYIFYIEKKGIKVVDPVWGFNCEVHIIVDI